MQWQFKEVYMSLSFITSGKFTNVASTPFYIALQQDISHFFLLNKSLVTTPIAGRIVKAYDWPKYDAVGSATVEFLGSGSSGASGNYGYAYALIPQTVASYTAPGTGEVLFDAVGPSSGVATTLGQADIVVANAGTYLVSFSVSGTGPNQFAIFVNDVPQQSTVGGSGAGTQQNDISAILTLPAGAVINLVNYVTGSGVGLATTVGGTQPNVTASVNVIGLASTSGASSALNIGNLAQQGFTLFDASKQVNGPSIAVASFTPGATTVWTTGAAHNFLVGDNVRVTGLTSAPQFGGLVMTVTAVGSPTTFTTLLNSTGAATSVGSVNKVGSAFLPQTSLYYPQIRAIAGITQAFPMVVTTLVQQNYQVGDVVTFEIPAAYGMKQLNAGLNGLPFQATVSAVNNAVGTQTVTFANVDSTAFTAFAWPAISTYPQTFPFMSPQGEGNTNNFLPPGPVPFPLPYGNQDILGFAKQNQGTRGILIGAGDGTSTVTTGGIIGPTVDNWEWYAITSTMSFPQL